MESRELESLRGDDRGSSVSVRWKVMAGRTSRKKVDRAGAGASDTRAASTPEEVPGRETMPLEASAASEANGPGEVVPCTRSHVPNARTRKTLRDADAGKNLTRYADEDDLFRKLGIELGQDEA
jgi:hypothetical protein